MKKKLKSLNDFKNDKKNVLEQSNSPFSIRGGIGGVGFTNDWIPVSTDQGHDKDTDCATNVVDDDGNIIVVIQNL